MKFQLPNLTKLVSPGKLALLIATMLSLGSWLFIRVRQVNPAILGDEYIYSINARKSGLWEPSPAGDFSNYLFNFVYQGTNLCGENFYSCAKGLNILFFLAFILTLFTIAIRFIPFWAAYGFVVASVLSPLSVYTSMFLPESMYFFCIGVMLVLAMRAGKSMDWQRWLQVGIAIGVTSLVKPHAWLTAIAIGIFFTVQAIFQRRSDLISKLRSGAALIGAAAAARIVIGVIVGGPRALGFFGQYVGETTFEQLTGSGLGSNATTEPSKGAIEGIVQLFPSQIAVHTMATGAIIGLSILAILSSVTNLVKTKRVDDINLLGLLSLIWLITMLVAIVLFTGWVTASGDDHTLRVLSRYYDFLFVIIPLAGLVSAFNGRPSETPAVLRWAVSAGLLSVISPAFGGFFASLQIQIADAPNLAGLVVDGQVFAGVALLTFCGLIVFAAFPRFTHFALLSVLPFSMIATGWQIQSQYLLFRGSFSEADTAGKAIFAQFQDLSSNEVLVLSTSRFDATNAAFWIDNPKTVYELFPPEAVVDKGIIPEGVSLVLALNSLRVEGLESVSEGETFAIYRTSGD